MRTADLPNLARREHTVAYGTPTERFEPMDATDLARLQFATTSIYHFLFVPVTIGLAFLVAILQTPWYRNQRPEYLRLTRFFGTLLLINVAIGVVTGLVQEFQFGMNWSAYSRFVGDVFGAPLAMEGLAAFFLESTFLGLWLFGWNVLPRGSTCVTHLDGRRSARRCRRRSSWPRTRGCSTRSATRSTPTTGRAAARRHRRRVHQPGLPLGLHRTCCSPSLVTGCVVMLAVSAWHLRRDAPPPPSSAESAQLALIVLPPVIG